jgi:hypothetical protein
MKTLQANVNSNCTPATIPPPADYSITRILHMTRDEWRAQLLHDIANTFEDAFNVLEATR